MREKPRELVDQLLILGAIALVTYKIEGVFGNVVTIHELHRGAARQWEGAQFHWREGGQELASCGYDLLLRVRNVYPLLPRDGSHSGMLSEKWMDRHCNIDEIRDMTILELCCRKVCKPDRGTRLSA